MKSFNNQVVSFLFIALLVFVAYSFASDKEPKAPKVSGSSFGKIKVNGTLYEKDIVIEGTTVRTRKKGPSKKFREKYNHTPLTHLEDIPWDCEVLVIGIGMSERLPVTEKFKAVAKKKGVTLIMMRTPEAVKYYNKNYTKNMNAIFHITC